MFCFFFFWITFVLALLFCGSFAFAKNIIEKKKAKFAAKLARSRFSEEERKTSKVKGVLGKKKLDPKRMLVQKIER